jgi:hypothetical protein
MEPESQPYRFKISLRLVHPSADLSSCSGEFGLEPSRLWIVGEPRTTPRGNPLEGQRHESYWSSPLDVSTYSHLEGALAEVARQLKNHSSFLAKHAESGGTASLFIGFFLESFNTGFLLAPELLAKYSSLGVALDFDMYGSDDEPGAP